MNKGHMDKAKGDGFKGGRQGGVGVAEWWGENGNNCTWTTIKKKKNYMMGYKNKQTKQC